VSGLSQKKTGHHQQIMNPGKLYGVALVLGRGELESPIGAQLQREVAAALQVKNGFFVKALPERKRRKKQKVLEARRLIL
jgi:hypothetical protein